MEQIYNEKMRSLGYSHHIVDIFDDWECVKDELLIPDRKSGSGNGTIHVFLGAGDAELRREFSNYYASVEGGVDPALGACLIKHFFLKSNIVSMIGHVCEYDFFHQKFSETFVVDIFNALEKEESIHGLIQTSSLFKLSVGSIKPRPYFKNFDSNGVFPKIIRKILLPESSYKISLYKNEEGEYAAFWLIGFAEQSSFEANPITEKRVQNSSASLQKIFFGTPGSGKSHSVKELTEGKKVHRTTFHPDSDYASFVGCYKPTMERDEIKYSFTPQVFTEAYIDAWKNLEEDVYLVIEEINRGNCAQIFGDLFQLLDRKADGYSDYRIKADSDLRDYLYSQLDKENEGIKNGELCLPPNLRIFATMNTSDQSLFPMDSAFKRRWDWEYIPVDYNEIRSDFVITIGEEKYHWLEFLKIVNERIRKATDSEDKQMGNFFIKTNVSEDEFKSKVMFYLWNEVCRDEYGTQNNFFRTSGEYEFSFNDLYQTDGLEKLQGFMTYLGVTTLSTTEHTDQTAEEPSEA